MSHNRQSIIVDSDRISETLPSEVVADARMKSRGEAISALSCQVCLPCAE